MASRMRLRGPVELLSAMPYLLGFHPTDSLVALGMRGSGLHLQLRGDLPHDHDAAVVLADHYGRLFRRNGIDGALLVGYGPPARAEPFLEAVRAAMTARGITVLDALRTHEGRFWSLLCKVPGCCPPEGRRFDPSTTIIAAEATLAGMVALPSRAAVAASFNGPVGPALVAIEEAGDRAKLRMIRLVTDKNPALVRAAAVAAGRAALDAALTRYESGGRLTDDELAWLQVLLLIVDFRDRAWERLDRDTRNGSTTEGHLRLWTDMVRRCEPAACAPSAVLLSYLSWRLGNGLHATLALDRAFDADAGYSAAGLMAEILGRGLSPEQVPPIGRSRRRRRKTRRVSARALSFAHTGTASATASGDRSDSIGGAESTGVAASGSGSSGSGSGSSGSGSRVGPRSRMRPRSRAGVCSVADGVESLAADGVEGATDVG
ncbi:DUF4192 domain-containing protein [Dactylosporangium sp. CS-047395]|uniref:DUF4192 domain-containing protein n=1 Tax=Dactylosporangium sp. CS-047395 TaxID=3239936 RepID=UPI003D8D22B1